MKIRRIEVEELRRCEFDVICQRRALERLLEDAMSMARSRLRDLGAPTGDPRLVEYYKAFSEAEDAWLELVESHPEKVGHAIFLDELSSTSNFYRGWLDWKNSEPD